MVSELNSIFLDFTVVLLWALLAGGLFFMMAGFRELKSSPSQGSLLMTLACFFVLGHFLVIATLADGTQTLSGVWDWLASMLAPALIALFLASGVINLVRLQVHQGLVKTFFGLTLVCYLYMLGQYWPMDVRGILAAVYGSTWLDVELRTAS